VINAIRTNEGPLALPYVRIQFGEGGDTLDIGGDSVQFTGDWPGSIYLHGKIISKSFSPTIKIGQGVTISSEAIIENTGRGFAIHNNGNLRIYGGTVSAYTCEYVTPDVCIPPSGSSSIPIYHDNEEFPLVLGGSPSIFSKMQGTIRIASGKLEVAPDFNPGTNKYYIDLLNDGSGSAGRVVVVKGAAYADNFVSVYGWVWNLVASGDDLVVDWIAPIIKSKVSSGLGIVLNGNSLQVVGISQATPVQVYDLRGNVVVSRTALPNESVSVSHLPKGVYVAKAGGKTVRVVK
jgi:hypothetical protein